MSDGPSFCWHCGHWLSRLPGGGLIFDLVRDPLGHLHRVHKHCTPDALGDGVNEMAADDPDHAGPRNLT